MRSDRERLLDIQDAIEQIEKHGKGAPQGFSIWSRWNTCRGVGTR